MKWLKIAESEIRFCAKEGVGPDLTSMECKAIADELDSLRAKIENLRDDLRSTRIALSEHNGDEQKLQDWAEICRSQSAELAALKGEAERTLYVQADFPMVAIEIAEMGDAFERKSDAERPAGATVYAVRLSARKVKP